MKSMKFFSVLWLAGPIFAIALAAECNAAKQTPKARDQVLRDTWYTMTLNGKVHFGYYNEKLETKQGRLLFQSHVWKSEEGFINEEQLGAFAENTSELAPLFFNFHSNYRTTELNIDGTVQENATVRMLSVKVRKNSQEMPIVKRSLSKQTILAQFFPVWLGNRLQKLEEGKSLSFYAVVEDNPDLNFAPVPGRVKLEKPDDFAKASNARKLTVTFQDLPSTWWVDNTGTAIRISMSGGGIQAEKTTKEKAQQFLTGQ